MVILKSLIAHGNCEKSVSVAVRYSSLAALLMAGCTAGTSVPAVKAVPPPQQLSGLPAVMTVAQRSTTTVPGTDDKLLLTVDDITRGQVMTSLSRADGQPVLAPRSMRSGESARFEFGGSEYVLTLKALDQSLVGVDRATVAIDAPGTNGLSESEKIDRLISAVESLEGAVFVRNGSEHAPREAAEHLRQKRQAAASRTTRAGDFIDQVASKSSLTGEEYRIRLPDGESVSAREFLHERLRELDAAEGAEAFP